MASFDEEFDLSDEDRQVLATDIKDLNEESFAAYKNKMAVLMKEKNKAAKKAKEEEMKKAKASEIKEEVVASTSSEQSATEVVDEVLDNSNVEKNSIPNSTATADVSLREKYSKAFGFEWFDIK